MAIIAPLPPSPAGEITHGNVREKINELVNRVNSGLPSFESETTLASPNLTISSDANSPTYIADLGLVFQSGGFELVTSGPWANTGAILNNTGLTLDMIGSFDMYPNNSGATSRLEIWSERSVDGIVVNKNSRSARSVEIGANGESTNTKSSRVTTWAPGEMLRFAMYDSGGGSVSLDELTLVTDDGDVTSPKFSWRLATVRVVV